MQEGGFWHGSKAGDTAGTPTRSASAVEVVASLALRVGVSHPLGHQPEAQARFKSLPRLRFGLVFHTRWDTNPKRKRGLSRCLACASGWCFTPDDAEPCYPKSSPFEPCLVSPPA